MLTAGIICEYNPFHFGHSYFIDRLRQSGATHIVAVMSGNFVQRGDAAVLSKWARTRQALLCGADLVVELPLPWAVAGAERFALGGVSLLDAVGADIIAFGSECGSVGRLREASRALASPLLREAMHESLRKGATFASARQSAVERLFGAETAGLLREPNNILGIEYLRAIDRIGSSLSPVTFARFAVSHNSSSGPRGIYASSGQIRTMLREGRDCSPVMPAASFRILKEEIEAGKAPASLLNAERAVLAHLRRMEKSDFSTLPDLSEGLENRIFAAARQATGLRDLYGLAKTKRYPLARIRRLVLSAFLGLTADDSRCTPPYLRILGIGKHGPEILKRAGKVGKLPIVSRFSDFSEDCPNLVKTAKLESRATDLYALCLPKIFPCGLDQTEKVITVAS